MTDPEPPRPATAPAPADPRADWLESQFRALHRIFGLLHPGARIRYRIEELDRPIGEPERVTDERRHLERINNERRYPDNVNTVPPPGALPWATRGFAGLRETGGAAGTSPAVTVQAPVPRRPESEKRTATKTAPTFANPAVNAVLKVSPLMLEQAKYLYEERQLRRREQTSRFAPWERPAALPLGRPDDTRDTARRPAILIGFHWLEMGGAEKLAFDSVAWALEAGFRVLVVADTPEVQRLADALPDSPDVEFLRTDAYLPGRLWPDFVEALARAENVRAVHVHHCSRLYECLPRLKALWPDIRVIDSTHIIEHANGGFVRAAGNWTNYIDHHHVISRQLAGFLLDHFGVSGKAVLGRMLDPAETRAERPDPSFSLDPGARRLRLAFVGRMVHQKRGPLAIDIVARLRDWARGRAIDLSFDMVGTGPYLDVVQTMIRRRGLEETVTLHPPDADVPAILKAADILLVPSANEGLALVCYEAIQNGAIPISTDVGGHGELLPADLLVGRAPLACVRQTVERVKRLATDADFLERCTAGLVAGYRDLRRDPTARDVLSALYRDILERAPAP